MTIARYEKGHTMHGLFVSYIKKLYIIRNEF